MAICLTAHPPGHRLSAGVEYLRPASPAEFRASDANCIDIGLINNMPDAALEATERQFLALLDAAADGIVVRLTTYALPDIPGRIGADAMWRASIPRSVICGTAISTASS